MRADSETHKTKEPVLKRPLDVALSFIMMVMSLPVSIPIALAIKMEDGGPVFYRQERWGRNGTRFWAYKFRTMMPDSDRKFGIRQATENDSFTHFRSYRFWVTFQTSIINTPEITMELREGSELKRFFRARMKLLPKTALGTFG